MSFRKSPAYWKVLGVLPGSPADAGGVTQGDLVTRINGEPVARWDLSRFDRLVAGADRIDFTFINGTQEAVKPVKVVDIVP
jgi:S1-C subfamily serine protease